MGTHSIHGPRRVRRAARLGLSGAAALLTIGAFAVFGSGSANAANDTHDEGSVVPVFFVQPTNTPVNTAVTPTVVVNVYRPDGRLDTFYNGPVTLTYAFNPSGAPLPTGNQVTAVNGVAKFPNLTFSVHGSGLELQANVPATPDVSGVADSTTGSDLGGTSAPSAPFDIVDNQVVCANVQGTCQTDTVSSDGASGFATATNNQGVIDATAGGFPRLSCADAGIAGNDGLLTFSSTNGMTVTYTLTDIPADLIGHPLKDFNACWGAAQTFITKSGVNASFNTANGDFEGLLPDCSAEPAPCVQSRSRIQPSGAVTLTVLAPPGDPHIMPG